MHGPTFYKFLHRRKDGLILWASGIGEVDTYDVEAVRREQPWVANNLADEGESDILDVYYRGATAPTQFYLGLLNSTPTDTTTLSTMTGEPSGSGYARQLIERSSVGFPTLALDAGDYKLTSSTETFTASGGTIGPVTYAFLATTSDNTGKFLNYVALSASRTLLDGDSLDVTLGIKLS